jgi:hypothetical protein
MGRHICEQRRCASICWRGRWSEERRKFKQIREFMEFKEFKEFREDRNLIPKFPNFLNLYNSPIFPNFLNFSNLPKKNKLRPIWVAVIIIYRCMPT